NGSTTWTEQTVAAATSGSVAYTSPAIAWTGTAAVISAAEYYTGDVDEWSLASGATTWRAQTISVPAVGNFCPATTIAWASSELVVAATDTSGDLDFWWQAANTTAWHATTVAAGTSGSVYYYSPSISWSGSHVLLAAVENYTGDLDFWSN